MQSTAVRRRLKFLPLFIFVALVVTAALCAPARGGGHRLSPGAESRLDGRSTKQARAQGAVSAARAEFAPANAPSRASRTMHGDPSLLLPELRAGRNAAPGALLLAPQVDPRLKPLGW